MKIIQFDKWEISSFFSLQRFFEYFKFYLQSFNFFFILFFQSLNFSLIFFIFFIIIFIFFILFLCFEIKIYKSLITEYSIKLFLYCPICFKFFHFSLLCNFFNHIFKFMLFDLFLFYLSRSSIIISVIVIIIFFLSGIFIFFNLIKI